MSNMKLQSAMEYLMTYGWAILIIAVVLGALFSLGIFSSSSFIGVTCIAGPGFLCQSPQLGTNGNLSIQIGQSTGTSYYNVGLGCVATTSSGGTPNPSSAVVYIDSSGAANALTANAPGQDAVALTLTSGQTATVSNLKCFDTNANAVTNIAVGQSFSGSLWMNYTLQSGAPGGSNPMITVKVATLTAKVQ